MSNENDIISNEYGYSYLKKNKIISVYDTESLAVEIFAAMKKQINDFKKSEKDIMDSIDEVYGKEDSGIKLSDEELNKRYKAIVEGRIKKKDDTK